MVKSIRPLSLQDAKFTALAQRMAAAVNGEASGEDSGADSSLSSMPEGVDDAGGGAHDSSLLSSEAACDRESCTVSVQQAIAAIVPGCGHAVHLERPSALLALLLNFFD